MIELTALPTLFHLFTKGLNRYAFGQAFLNVIDRKLDLVNDCQEDGALEQYRWFDVPIPGFPSDDHLSSQNLVQLHALLLRWLVDVLLNNVD